MTKSMNREGGLHAWRRTAGNLHDLPHGRTPTPTSDNAPLLRSNIVKKLKPDQKGARRLSDRFGDRLVCVRYRTDPESGRRFTTVEIIVEERASTTPAPTHQLIRIGWGETQLRDTIKTLGGIWVPGKKLWKVPSNAIRKLKLQKRVALESA